MGSIHSDTRWILLVNTLMLSSSVLFSYFGILNINISAMLLLCTVLIFSIRLLISPVDHDSTYPFYIVLAVSVAFVCIIKLFNPYPIQIDDDVTKEAIRINFIAKTGYAPFLIPPFRPIAYDSMLAAAVQVFHVGAAILLYYVPFVLVPVFALSVMYFAKAFLIDWPRSIIAAVISLFVCGFFTLGAPVIPVPFTISLVLSMVVLAWYANSTYTGWIQFLAVSVLMVIANIGYYYALLFFLPMLVLMQVYPIRRISLSITRFILLPLSVAALFASMYIYDVTVGSTEVSPSFTSRFIELFASYTDLMLSFILMGSLIAIKRISRNHTFFSVRRIGKNSVDDLLTPILVFSALGLLLYLLPFTFSNRTEMYIRPELSILGAVGMFGVRDLMLKRFPSRRALLTACILLLSFTVMLQPYYYWITAQVPNNGGAAFNTYSSDEANAGLWLSHQKMGYVISDMSTSMIMQSLSQQSGMWSPIYFLNNTKIFNDTYYFFANPVKWLPAVTNSSIIYVVVSTRTDESINLWRTLNNSSPTLNELYLKCIIYYPTTMVPNSTFWGYPLIYSNPSVRIYNDSQG